MKTHIHFSRIGKPEMVYVENLEREDAAGIVTFNTVPPEQRVAWGDYQGVTDDGALVCAVRKHHFYQEWFDVIELFGERGELIAYYCDVITPLRKENGEYYLQDLLLDLWIFPDGRAVELDWDEFEAAARAGLITEEQQQKAVETLKWMVERTREGVFPGKWLGG